MNAILFIGLTFLAAYLVGSVPFGYLVARWRGVDIFTAGSGNIGATNVGRVLGRRWGLLVFALDFAKGALPVLAGMKASTAMGLEVRPEIGGVTAGLGAFLGHLLPIFLGFRGGKGVATGAGVVVVLATGPVLAALALWTVIVVSTRTVSLGSLTAAAVFCLLRLAGGADVWNWPSVVVTVFCLAAVGMVFWRHQANLLRLVRGEENRLKDSATMLLFGKVLHLLAVGLWFGMAAFFTFVVGVQLFRTFERLSIEPRPMWFPMPPEFAGAPPSPRFPDPLRKEQGSRLAGAAVGPLFDWYFPLQMGCGIVALVTSLSWSMSRRGETAARLRSQVLAAALVLAFAGWWLEREVTSLREQRSTATDAVLMSPQPTPGEIARAEEARDQFGRWHFASLLLNFATLLLVTLTMGLAAALPTWLPEEKSPASPAQQSINAMDETEQED